MTGTTGPRRPPDETATATLALTALTLAAAVGMGRLFAGSSHLVPFTVAALVAHGVMWGGRRRGVNLAANVALALGAVVVTIAWLVLPETTVFGVPGPSSWRAAGLALDQAWSEFSKIVAPAPVNDGFLIAGMAGVGFNAVLADWAAFRMGVLFEALLPSFTLFVFTAALGADERRSLLVALYLVALLGFLLVHQWGSRAGTTAWFASRAAGGRGALVKTGAVLGGVAVFTGLVVGPRLPGAAEPPVLALREADRPGGGRRTTVSPLVDIRGRLVDRSTVEVFTVRSNTRAYWRLTSLDTFNGDIWSSDASYEPTRSRLPGGVPDQVPVDRTVQEFTIGALSSIWLPAAYRPQRLEGVDGISFNEGLGSLITTEDTTNGLTYRVLSEVPRYRAAALAGAGTGGLSGEARERFLQFEGVSPAVARLARELAARSDGTPFGQARALQDYFQRGFTYDLSARPGHDGPALDTFLFRTQRGYCEQFAGAYGVLARLLGLPTRVAVGFTPGELGPDGQYHVQGLNAHAWPEVYFEGAGWVAFEPTPGRGQPGAEDYTGLPEAQATPGDPSTATTAVPGTTAAPGPTNPAPGPTIPDEPGVTAGAPAGPRPVSRHPLVRTAVVALLVALAGAGAIVLAKALRRQRRRKAATTPGQRVLVAWTEAVESLAGVGAGRRPAETLDEHARRAPAVARLAPEAAEAMADLAGEAGAASYAARPVAPGTVERAVAAAATVESAVRANTARPYRLLRAVDPRPLVGRPLVPPRKRRRATTRA